MKSEAQADNSNPKIHPCLDVDILAQAASITVALDKIEQEPKMPNLLHPGLSRAVCCSRKAGRSNVNFL